MLGTDALAQDRQHGARGRRALCRRWLLDLGIGSSPLEGCDDPMQDPLPEQIQLGAPIPQAFEPFDPAHLPFTLACAPGRSQCGSHRVLVLANAPGDRRERWEL